MAAVNLEAVQELNIAVDVLMPDAFDAGVTAATMLSINDIYPTGLGGFIRLNDEETADIIGRRIKAELTVLLQGNDLTDLQSSAAAVVEAYMGADEAMLAENGFLKIRQTGSVYRQVSGANLEMTLTFELLYEYQQIPEETEEIIGEIPVNIHLDTGRE